MRQYYYLKGLRRTIIQFLDTLNDIQVARYNRDKSFSRYWKVPIKFGPKKKTWYWLNEKSIEDRKYDEMLPMIAVTMNSLEFAADRMNNKLYKVSTRTPSAGTVARFDNPVPYNILLSANIWALNMTDADQIIEQILADYAPYIVMRVGIEELDLVMDIKVVFQGLSPDVTFDMGDDDNRMIKYTLDFMLQGYLYKPVSDTKLIHKIIRKYYVDEDAWADYKFTETTFTSGASGHEAIAALHKGVSPWYDNAGDKVYEYYVFDSTATSGGGLVNT